MLEFMVKGLANELYEQGFYTYNVKTLSRAIRMKYTSISVDTVIVERIAQRIKMLMDRALGLCERDEVTPRLDYNDNGLILFEGPSHYDGSPIVVIITGLINASKNPKTGNILQTWILRQDISPCEASESGGDVSVCGTCPLRTGQGGACYVKLFQAPSSIWKAYRRGSYRKANESDIKKIRSRIIRIGAYGDPAAVPVKLWRDISGPNRTGYTHGWRFKKSLASHTMASVENLEDMAKAQSLGFRTFRILRENEEITENEILCPAVSKGVSCDDCLLCKGNTIQSKSVAIPVHGACASRL